MIVYCPEVKEVVITDPETHKKEKVFAYTLVLDKKFPQNRSTKAAQIQFVAPERRRDIEPGEFYTILFQPFVVATEKVSKRNGKARMRKEPVHGVQGQDSQ